jgi:outer membrane lipoprotein-sorting protein
MKYFYLALALITFSAFAQSDEKAEEILNKMSKEIKALNSFSIDFSFSMKNPTTGENTKEAGKGLVKGDKFYATLGDNEIISNGVKIWTIVKEEKVTYESDADEEDEESINPKKLMTIWESGFKSKYVKEDKVGAKSVHVINLFPKKAGDAQYHTITLYVDTKTTEMVKGVMKMKDGTTMTYEITKFEKNVDAPATKFVYDPKKYPGYKLIKD